MIISHIPVFDVYKQNFEFLPVAISCCCMDTCLVLIKHVWALRVGKQALQHFLKLFVGNLLFIQGA